MNNINETIDFIFDEMGPRAELAASLGLTGLAGYGGVQVYKNLKARKLKKLNRMCGPNRRWDIKTKKCVNKVSEGTEFNFDEMGLAGSIAHDVINYGTLGLAGYGAYKLGKKGVQALKNRTKNKRNKLCGDGYIWNPKIKRCVKR